MSKFKYEPYKKQVDKDQIKYEDQKAYSDGAGKGDTPRHTPSVYGPKFDKIDWSKNK